MITHIGSGVFLGGKPRIPKIQYGSTYSNQIQHVNTSLEGVVFLRGQPCPHPKLAGPSSILCFRMADFFTRTSAIRPRRGFLAQCAVLMYLCECIW